MMVLIALIYELTDTEQLISWFINPEFFDLIICQFLKQLAIYLVLQCEHVSWMHLVLIE